MKLDMDKETKMILENENLLEIESLSVEELLKREAVSKKVEEESKLINLLKKGTLTQDKRFYLTERTAEKFVMDYSSLEDDEKLVWRDTSKNIVELTKAEAKPYVMEIKTVLRKVYGLLE
jgi:hypothetical protein